MTIAAQLHALFRGSPYMRGVSRPRGAEKDSVKVVAKQYTNKVAVTEADWQQHLNGTCGLGVGPATDGRSWFAAIDLDDYNMDKGAIVRKVYDLDIGALPCYSKSGGLHLYFFFDGEVRTPDVRALLLYIATMLGYPKAEIFPKQDESFPTSPGNWINMPYFSGASTTRHALSRDMVPLSLEEFLAAADANRMSSTSLYRESVKLGLGAPECITSTLTENPTFARGTRHNTRKSYVAYIMGKNIEDKEGACKWFATYATPVATVQDAHDDTDGLIRGWESKGFLFSCIEGRCADGVCGKLAKHALTDPTDMEMEGGAQMTIYNTDPPIYIIEYPGRPAFTVPLEDLFSSSKVRLRCVQAWKTAPVMPKQKAWDRVVNTMLASHTLVEPPRDSSVVGALETTVMSYCRDGRRSMQPHRTRSWVAESRHWFTMSGLMLRLEDVRFKGMERPAISMWLHTVGAVRHTTHIDGLEVDAISMPLYPGGEYSPPPNPEDVI